MKKHKKHQILLDLTELIFGGKRTWEYNKKNNAFGCCKQDYLKPFLMFSHLFGGNGTCCNQKSSILISKC